MDENKNPEEFGDPSVPTELLELHVLLEEEEVSPKEFKEVYGNETSDSKS